MAQQEFSGDPLDTSEIKEVRAILAARRWWRGFWQGLSILADRFKVIGGLAPWIIGFWLLFGERIQEVIKW